MRKQPTFRPARLRVADGAWHFEGRRRTRLLTPNEVAAVSDAARAAVEAGAGEWVEVQASFGATQDEFGQFRLADETVEIAPAAEPRSSDAPTPVADFEIPDDLAESSADRAKLDSDASFINPYTFIPTIPLRRSGTELSDGPGESLACHSDGRYSGVLTVRMTAQTPLLVPDTSNATWRPGKGSKGANDHMVVDIELRDGVPLIRGSAVKGMLRSAYEAATNSRYGVFGPHERRWAFRHPATIEKSVSPVRIEIVDGQRKARKLQEARFYAWGAQDVEPMDDFDHGSPATAVVSSGKYGMRAKNVMAGTNGWVTKTGRTMKKKTSEAYLSPTGSRPEFRVSEQVAEDWKLLILELRRRNEKWILTRWPDQRKPADPAEMLRYVDDKPGNTAIAPHLWAAGLEELPEGTLCWAEVDGNKIVSLSPTKVRLSLFDTKPDDIVHDVIRPALTVQEFSPADRVFGLAAGQGGTSRARLTVGSVRCCSPAEKAYHAIGGQGLPLPILSSPKAQQGRFYAARDLWGNPLPKGSPRSDQFLASGGLRGRKAYHPRSGLRDTGAQVLRRNDSVADDQNRTIKGVVKTGAEFEFALRFQQLRRAELGALLWLLTWQSGRVHRFGGGKPIGFGSVKLELNSERSWWEEGSARGSQLRSLTNHATSGDQAEVAEFVEHFQDELGGAIGEGQRKRLLDSVVAASTPKGMNAVGYPLVTGQDGGSDETYAWFVANERTESIKGTGGVGFVNGYSLPAADDEVQKLPKLEPAKDKSK